MWFRNYPIIRFRLILGAFILVGCAGQIPLRDVNPKTTDFYVVTRPDERRIDPVPYFAHEYTQIIRRRENTGFADSLKAQRPSKIVGLALSGGGIRSAAYHLGLLSGLSKGHGGSKTLLGRIDYISSVSGGGWANGAYWAWQGSDADLFGCLNEAALLGGPEEVSDQCKVAARMLRAEQELGVLPIEGQRKVIWEEDIASFYLSDCNVDFSELRGNASCSRNYELKPYPIFNSAHSVPLLHQRPDVRNFPFETTPDYFGTIIDCNSENVEIMRDCEDGKAGFFVRQDANDFTWWNRKWQRYWKFWSPEFLLRDGGIPGTFLSTAMAHSSGVAGAAILLQYNFDLRYRGQNIDAIREIYKLTDGGKVDNLGLIPLVERGVDLIIVSYMGKDNDPLKDPFEDLKLARAQVRKLFRGCDVGISEVEGHEKEFAFLSTYECKSHKGNKIGDIIHVKPSHTNVEEFIGYLKNEKDISGASKYGNILQYLEKEKEDKGIVPNDRFPQTVTMIMKYDQKLIRAYYLLGEYVARKHVNEKIQKWLESDRGQ